MFAGFPRDPGGNPLNQKVSSFNQPLASWNVSSVTDMSYMFYFSSSFNQPLDSWDVRSVFYDAERPIFYGAATFFQVFCWHFANMEVCYGRRSAAPRRTTAVSRAPRRARGWLDDVLKTDSVAVRLAAKRKQMTYPHPNP